VADVGRGLRLLEEPRDLIRIADVLVVQHLHRDLAIDHRVAARVDRARPAGAELALDHIAPDARSDQIHRSPPR